MDLLLGRLLFLQFDNDKKDWLSSIDEAWREVLSRNPKFETQYTTDVTPKK